MNQQKAGRNGTDRPLGNWLRKAAAQFVPFVKKEPVLVIAGVLAVISMFFVPPSAEYISYIDFRTLGILFCLMAAVAGLNGAGLFHSLAHTLARKAGTIRRLSFLLVTACFVLSMFITNDVALITFVPLTVLLLETAGERTLILTVVMETIGANLGSALTPFGNPQNLYLYSRYEMGAAGFFAVTVPICLMGFVLIAAGMALCRIPAKTSNFAGEQIVFSKKQALFFGGMFLFCLLAVFHILSWLLVLGVVLLALLLAARPVFRRVDYSLLVTFVFFFILVGNLGNIPAIQSWLSGLMDGRELVVSALASQVISNVPAALMLSGFTGEWRGLLAGVNIGGLGTLIAPMASLISFRLYARAKNAKPGRFFGYFTVFNILYLIIMLAVEPLILKGVTI